MKHSEVNNVKIRNISSASSTQLTFVRAAIKSQCVVAIANCHFQNQNYHFFERKLIKPKKHYRGFHMAAMFLPKFLEFLATSCLACLVLSHQTYF